MLPNIFSTPWDPAGPMRTEVWTQSLSVNWHLLSVRSVLEPSCEIWHNYHCHHNKHSASLKTTRKGKSDEFINFTLILWKELSFILRV